MVKKLSALSVARRLREKLLDQGVIPYGARLLVGVSGGADSMTLLRLLFSLRHELALDIVVAHYDHALRRGSARDALWVKAMARDLGLSFLSERNRSRCPRGASLEAFARTCRFDFFVRMARKAGADAVVLAHTQDDLAETVLLRILRGTGLMGLRGILPQRSMQGVMFLRPLLGVTRDEVEAFLKEVHVSHIEDPTNAGDDFLRNRVRHQLIPYIAKAFAPAIKEKLAQLAVNAAYDHEVLEGQMNKVLGRVLKVRGNVVSIALRPWRSCNMAIRRMVIREAVSRFMQGDVQLSHEHAAAIESAAMAQEPLARSLPAGLKIKISDKSITLS